MKKQRWIRISFPILLVFGLYFTGPAPDAPVFDANLPAIPEEPELLESYVRNREGKHNVKPDNQARIVWNDTNRRKTDYAVLYLHGFSASQKEGDPVHVRFARQFGCNLYLARLADHGIDTTEALLYYTADRAWDSAKEALAISRRLGEKVIILSTSTGGTLALMLAARYPHDVHALINLSPNIAINNPAAFILNDPWGLYIARMVMGGKYRETGASPEKARYWNAKYRLEAAVELEELIESSMTLETFASVRQPSLTLYYYKSEVEQDPEVKVSAMLAMHQQLATPDSLKAATAMPDAAAHVLGSSMTSRDVDGVYREMAAFAVGKLGLAPRAQVAQIP